MPKRLSNSYFGKIQANILLKCVLGLFFLIRKLKCEEKFVRYITNLIYKYKIRRSVMAIEAMCFADKIKDLKLNEKITLYQESLFQNGTMVFHLFIKKHIDCKIINIDSILNAIEKHKHVILLSGHFAGWEYVGRQLRQAIGSDKLGVIYKDYGDVLDEYAIQARGFRHYKTSEMRNYIADIKKGNLSATCVLVDQYHHEGDTLMFLGRETKLSSAMPKFAINRNMPVFFLQVKPKNGVFVGDVKQVFDPDIDKNIEHTVVMKRMVGLLEENIIEHPSIWMCWNHNMWDK